ARRSLPREPGRPLNRPAVSPRCRRGTAGPSCADFHTPVVVDPSGLAPPTQHAPSVVVRRGYAVQLCAGGRAPLGTLGLVVRPHPLFGGRLRLLPPRLARDQREHHGTLGLVASL